MATSLDLGNRRYARHLCECGCGEFVKCSGSRFMLGHYIRTEEHNRKNSESHIGKHLSKETIKKMSESRKGENHPFYGKHHSEESIAKIRLARRKRIRQPMQGKHHSKETIIKMRKERKEWWVNLDDVLKEEYCLNMSRIKEGCKHSEEIKEKIRKALEGVPKSEEHRDNLGKAKRGITKEMNPNLAVPLCRRNFASQRMKECWDDPEFREKRLACLKFSPCSLPTKPEKKLRRGLNKLFPNEYKYVGDGDTFIGGKCPDFININGQKKVIEMFGDYWHGERRTGRTKRHEEQRRIRHFAKYGFRTLIVWQSELRNIKYLKKKLIEFHNERE